MTNSERLTRDHCRAKATECRDMARSDANAEHRIMLDHMAETWDRIGQSIKGNGRE